MTEADGKTMPCLLVVEDEPLILMDLTFAGEDLGAEVLQATTSKKALALIDKHRIDAAILDVNLGGGQNCGAVAARLGELGVPFVLHSGDLDRQGELIRRLNAPIFPKPTVASTVAEAALGLASDERAKEALTSSS